ncbi:MAG: DNA polymerase III subunit gamma/tau [Prosthecobacter sp.]|uniref:DNA polymerase III subunit gamma/tau n=1 Tax=Prosthecobacter sp. TaxID=1965333 RepID=UPI0019DC6CCF|nr:DNA polymerase III subunit gamma/tau [Prosthecobacter sp.]MBE2282898.1 DNA polymerase III subunit gamma/tau [Prosthecobacter sp.]
MSYQVFARKYRPRTFADVLGQEHVVRTLRNAIAQNRLAHAYLFVGPRGTGKTSTARIFAKALCAKGGPTIDFDPDDELSIEIAEGRCMDVLEIDGASNNGVEQVRELRDNVKFAPTRCPFKIYYIDEVHMLTAGAFNALLKTLEEPPPHVKFIFATTEANKILPTIISRCQRFDLRRIPNAIIAKHLLHIADLEKVQLDEKAAYAIGKGAEGGMRDAQSMLDQLVAFCGEKITEQDVLDVFGFTSGESVARLARSILESDTVGALRSVYDQNEAGKDLGRLLGDLIQHFRTLLVQQADPEAASEDLSPELIDEIAVQAQMATTEQLLRVVDGLAEVDSRMRWASNKRLHFELGVIAAVQSLNEVSISDVIEALDSGSGAGLPKPAPRPQTAPPPLRRAAAPVMRETEPVKVLEEPRSEALVARSEAPVSNLRAAIAAAEPAPAPGAQPAPAPQRQPEVAPVEPPSAATVSTADFWPKLVQTVQERRPLAVSWLQVASLLGITGRTVKVGFPTTEGFARESLMRPAQLGFLEGLAQELLGQPVKLELVLDASLKAPEFTEMGLGLLDEPPPPTKPKIELKPEPKPEMKAEAKPAVAATPAAQEAAKVDPEFYNDPLIRKAMEKFKAKLVPAG